MDLTHGSAGDALTFPRLRSHIDRLYALAKESFVNVAPRRPFHLEMIEALNDVAEAVSAARCVDDVLTTITEKAKQITGADKAVLVLTDGGGGEIDPETVVVRGRMSLHLQEWWLARMEALCRRGVYAGAVFTERNRADRAWLLCSPVRFEDRAIGMLAVIDEAERPFTELHGAMLSVLSSFAASAIENARSAEEARSVLLESERERISRELHDGIVQSLFSISLGLEACRKQTLRDPAAVAERLHGLQRELGRSMTELRRFVYDLRPQDLRTLGLVGAVGRWVREVTESCGIKGRLVVAGERRTITAVQEACLYALAKESVSNVVRHAKASRFEVRITFSEDAASIFITDDGMGFDVGSVYVRGDTGGLGLVGMRERVESIGGGLTVRSSAGSGTVVTAMVPAGEVS